MTKTTVTEGPQALDASVLYLPGRSVERTVTPFGQIGVVVDVDVSKAGGPEYLVRWGHNGVQGFESVPGVWLRPVTPDRPVLSRDEFVVGALGEKLAERNGPESLAGFHRGHNDGRIAYTEAARAILADIDRRAFTLRHQRCRYTYVIDATGTAERARGEAWQDGDRLVECLFFADGPDAHGYCAVHLVDVMSDRPPSIFYATDEQRTSGEAIALAPITAPGVPAEQPRVLTEVEQQQADIDDLVTVIRKVLIDEAQQQADSVEGGADWPGMGARELRAGVDAEYERRGGYPMALYWDAIAHGIRQGRIRLHQGPRYSPAPDYTLAGQS